MTNFLLSLFASLSITLLTIPVVTLFPRQRFLKTLAISSTAFLFSGLLIQQLMTQQITVLLDRSYCPASEWQQISQDYAQLYQQHQRKQTRIATVILFSDLNQSVLYTPPLPEAVRTLKTYGQFNARQQTALVRDNPRAILLSCHRF